MDPVGSRVCKTYHTLFCIFPLFLQISTVFSRFLGSNLNSWLYGIPFISFASCCLFFVFLLTSLLVVSLYLYSVYNSMQIYSFGVHLSTTTPYSTSSSYLPDKYTTFWMLLESTGTNTFPPFHFLPLPLPPHPLLSGVCQVHCQEQRNAVAAHSNCSWLFIC